MSESTIEFVDKMYVEHISEEDFIGEIAMFLSFRDETQEDVPKFQGPSHRIETEQVIENYIEIDGSTHNMAENETVYSSTAVFDDSGEEFDIKFFVSSDDDERLQVKARVEWSVNYHNRKNFMLEVKMMKKTQEAILDGVEEIVGSYNVEFEDDVGGIDSRPGRNR